ncbi:hypothetical protein [Paenibacillus woosongensis]|uniref:Phage protein n=1 Tax=Paenibacillus woosongensis TaxID=307580 RepID=A0ABQ4MPT4_9BACL|nr:hypothetical protein [Paenibacillus woosongensis]GIP57909.1 hypothetical protein J15TS10_17230 [Paenibacillus woosongensis]
MRLLRKDMKPVIFRERIPKKEPDGTPYEDWATEGIEVRGNVQPAGGKEMAAQYGERLRYIMVMYCEYTPDSRELLEQFNSQNKGYGACVFVPGDAEMPDYKVVAVRPWRHIVIELEMI